MTAPTVLDRTCVVCVPDWTQRDPSDSHGLCEAHEAEFQTAGTAVSPLPLVVPEVRGGGEADTAPRCSKGYAFCDGRCERSVHCEECGGRTRYIHSFEGTEPFYECVECNWWRARTEQERDEEEGR